MLTRPALTALLAWLAFVAVLLAVYGFQFGRSNNTEEVPVIYRLAGLAAYPHDAFVQESLQVWSQGTPYFYLMSLGGRLAGQPGVVVQFALVHLLSLTLVWLALRRIWAALGGRSELILLGCVFLLILLDKRTGVVPNGRHLFTFLTDPEPVAMALALMSLACLVQARWTAAAFWLF